ncbi:hypothetical protein BDZ97DRAFT_1758581 [Flammula alnicola]|nr:hypothetical protein BDZ97DRAFT_1758581 [Flammula alnicola]
MDGPQHLQDTPGMALGVYATRDLRVGDLVMAEPPLLVMPVRQPRTIMVPPGAKQEEATKILAGEMNRIVETALGKMTPEQSKAFTELENVRMDVAEQGGPIVGIVHTNSFRVPLYDGSAADDLTQSDVERCCTVLSPRYASRINHSRQSSCMPNVNQTSKQENRFSIPTARLKSVAVRRKNLKPYSFVCVCVAIACANATKKTDKLREIYIQSVRDFQKQYANGVKTPNLNGDVFTTRKRRWRTKAWPRTTSMEIF